MALVAFAILFAGVLNDYVAAARAAAMLTFVLPVMVPAGAAVIPTRLAGWGLAGALCDPRDAAAVARAPAQRAARRSRTARRARWRRSSRPDRGGDRDRLPSRRRRMRTRRRVAVRDRFVSMPHRPSGTASPTAALARLIEDLGWLRAIADRGPVLGERDSPCAAERAEIEAAVPRACAPSPRDLDRWRRRARDS